MKHFPRISIVTPSFNQGQYIEQTIVSVLSQNYPNLEYIIIDGASIDGSAEIIKKYEGKLKYWVTEPDFGQAHAINKGLQHCTGEIFNWLNSDDFLEPGALFKIAAQFSTEERPALVAGEVEIFDENGSIEYVKHAKLSARGLMIWEQGVTFVQPGVWMLRENIEKCGGIDERFHYAFDWDLLIRYLYLFPNVAILPEKLINFRYHRASKTVSAIQKFADEENKIIKKISESPEYVNLQYISKIKLLSNEWMPQLKQIKEDHKSKISKLYRILHQHKLKYIPIWRATLGAMRQIIISRNLFSFLNL